MIKLYELYCFIQDSNEIRDYGVTVTETEKFIKINYVNILRKP